MKKSYNRIFAQLFNQPWLITEDWMASIIEIANREGDIEAVEAKLADPLHNTETATFRDGVAILNVSGPIFPKANLFTRISGATSIDTLARDLTSAVENEEVDSIILNVDSPGGHVTGINEMANMIRQYSAIKPIHGYSGGTAASAGYWLLSSCTDVTVDATARLGSIGVVVALPKKGEEDTIEIVNTSSPNKRVDYSTEKGKAVVVDELDALAEVFISSVAGFRSVTNSVVTKNFGKGGILVGADAVNAGMADKIGSFEELLKEKSKGGNSMNKQYDVTALSLKESNPSVYDEIFSAGAASTLKESEYAAFEKDKEIGALKDTVSELTASNSELTEKVSTFAKQEAIREEQALGATASAIISDKLSLSTVPVRLHPKVKALVSYDTFVIEGKLDVDKFSASVDAEISSWEESSSSVDGIGTNTHNPVNSDFKVSDDLVAHLVSIS